MKWPIEVDISLPWPNRHEPYVALDVSKWGYDVYRGRSRPVTHVLLMWGRRFTGKGGHRAWQARGRWS